jgi:hypothetical protein
MWPPMPWANAPPLAAKVTVATRAAAKVLVLVMSNLLGGQSIERSAILQEVTGRAPVGMWGNSLCGPTT